MSSQASGGLQDLLPAVAAMFGVPRCVDRIGLAGGLNGGVRQVVVLLVDGLGEHALAEHGHLTPKLMSGKDLGGLNTPIPTTTAAALTSFGTGLPVGQHGIVASAFEVEETPLWPLSWRSEPNPIATQPEPTVFERMSAAGVSVATAAPAKFRTSGLTRAALRGGRFLGTETAADRVAAAVAEIKAAQLRDQPGFAYVYWPDLDQVGHVHGVASPQWCTELAVVEALTTELIAGLPAGSALLMTADHGMLNIADVARFDLDLHPTLGIGVRRVLGEPRLRHVYCEPGAVEATLRRWRRVLAEVAVVVDRDEAAERWFAPLDPWYRERIGDVVAMASQEFSLVSDRVDRVVSNLRGQHGADHPVERRIPLRAWFT